MTLEKIDNIQKKFLFIFFIVISILLYIVLLCGCEDTDMYFEIVSGKDILNGNFHTASHLNNYPIIVQQWLYTVCLAIFDQFGYIGYISWVFIQDLILWLLASIFIYKKTNNRKIALIGSFISIIICEVYMVNIRPQIITMIFLILELLIIEAYKEHNRQIRYLLILLPILIISANFHQAVFLYHIFILAPYCIGKNGKWWIDWKLIDFIPLFIACSICTPYGLDGALYIIRTFQSKVFQQISIQEITALDITSIHGVTLFTLLGIVIYAIYNHKSNKYINFYMFSIFILSLINGRHICLLYIVLVYILCYLDITKYINQTLMIICIVFFIMMGIIHLRKIDNIENQYNDVATIIEDKNATIYNHMDVGGWLEYNDYTKVTFDTRPELFTKTFNKKKNLIHNYLLISYGYDEKRKLVSDDTILKKVEDYDYIIFPSNAYINRIANKKFHLIYENNYCIWENNNIGDK